MAETAACDFFVVMSLGRRRILHINATKHPTAEWTAQQLFEVFPGDGWMPRFLQRVRDIVATPVLGGRHHRYSRAA
jgi:hypothetical protein